MRRREILLGLAVLGLVLGGVFWARGRVAPVRAAVAAGDELPDVTLQDAVAELDGVTLTLSVAPRPAVAFANHRWRVRAVTRGAAVPIDDGRLTFEMAMPMGDHRYRLVPAGDGWHEAEAVLPSCPSGKRRWFATFDGTIAGGERTARFRVDLAPAAPRPVS
jgi:hypothetical protein